MHIEENICPLLFFQSLVISIVPLYFRSLSIAITILMYNCILVLFLIQFGIQVFYITTKARRDGGKLTTTFVYYLILHKIITSNSALGKFVKLFLNQHKFKFILIIWSHILSTFFRTNKSLYNCPVLTTNFHL